MLESGHSPVASGWVKRREPAANSHVSLSSVVHLLWKISIWPIHENGFVVNEIICSKRGYGRAPSVQDQRPAKKALKTRSCSGEDLQHRTRLVSLYCSINKPTSSSMCCSYHCPVIRVDLAKMVWSSLSLPESLCCSYGRCVTVTSETVQFSPPPLGVIHILYSYSFEYHNRRNVATVPYE